jgi:hypothetical protein
MTLISSTFCPKKVQVSVLVTPLECTIVLMPIKYLFIYLFIHSFIYVCVCGQHDIASLKTLSVVEIPSTYVCYFDGILYLYITNFKT